MTQPRYRVEDYTVGWICALPIELAAAAEMLDEEHQDLPQDANDTNVYSLGRIGEHNVVIACLPAGQMGTNPAATVASQMKSTFVSIRFGLLVGIGGGVPSAESDIRLGDVVISQPHMQHGGVVQYDYGKIGTGGRLTRVGSLNAPPTVLLNALSKLRSNHLRRRSSFSVYLSQLTSRLPDFASERAGPDVLFEPNYDHAGEQTCDQCSSDRTIKRTSRGSEGTVVHCGTIASGNVVMKDGATRDTLSLELGGVLCFEMEAAGLMNNFPCLVIRGICDYADSHKNKKWQPHAAATAAACAKELLSVIPSAEVTKTSSIGAGDSNLPASEEEAKDIQCLRDLRLTDPRDDKKRIEASKDALLEDSCAWILQDPDFLRWRNSNDSQLLWIKGDPGKGKTMMMIALIDEFSREQKARPESCVLSYFFCQSTDPRLNNAISILKGLVYLLAVQQKTLLRHLRERYDTAGSQLFEGPNAFYALSAILLDMLNDSSPEKVFLMVDALDECDSGLPQLLDLIAPNSPEPPPKVKWLVASRNRPDIERQLRPDGLRLKISLELSLSHISRAVNAFIDFQVSKLAKRGYSNELREEVRGYLYENSGGTFLWVALVCKRLLEVSLWKTKSALKGLPPGLEPLYDQMMDQIRDGNDTDDVEVCEQILSSVTLAYRPIHLKELVVTAGLPEELSDDLQSLNELVELCGSFLTVREETVYFVHQSAKDYFSTGSGSKVFPLGQTEAHLEIASRSLKHMSSALKRDIYDLQVLGTFRAEVIVDVNQGPLSHIQYACCYWVDHLCHASHLQRDQTGLSDGGTVHTFLRTYFLYWLEALSLVGFVYGGVIMMINLEAALSVRESIKLEVSLANPAKPSETPLLSATVYDAKRFVLSYRSVIEKAPLQIYSSILFSPNNSETRRLFKDQAPGWVTNIIPMSPDWNPSLQVLEGHTHEVLAVAFSPGGQLLASSSLDGTVRLWDPVAGTLVNILRELPRLAVTLPPLAFSPDGLLLTSASSDERAGLWDPAKEASYDTLKSHTSSIAVMVPPPDGHTVKLWNPTTSSSHDVLGRHLGMAVVVLFSPDGKLIASTSYGDVVSLWNATTGIAHGTLSDHSERVFSVAFSPDSRLLASASGDGTVILWDPITRVSQSTFTAHTDRVMAVAFSPDGRLVASASHDGTVRLWDPETKVVHSTFPVPTRQAAAVAFSPDGKLLAYASANNRVLLWNPLTRALHSVLDGHSSLVGAVAFSPDGRLIASGSQDRTVKLWDPVIKASHSTFEIHAGEITAVAFSSDGRFLASASRDNTAMLWDPTTGASLGALTGHTGPVRAVVFSPDSQLLASGSHDGTFRFWDPIALASQGALNVKYVTAAAISPNGRLLASASLCEVELWELTTRASYDTFEGKFDWFYAVAFSPDSQLLAAASGDRKLRLWNIETKQMIQVLETDGILFNIRFTNDGSHLVTNQGVLRLTVPNLEEHQTHLNPPRCLYANGRWVSCNNENILLLPPDYQASCFAVHGNILALGHPSGRVTFLTFNLDSIPLSK